MNISDLGTGKRKGVGTENVRSNEFIKHLKARLDAVFSISRE